jgi:hypothetical protein
MQAGNSELRQPCIRKKAFTYIFVKYRKVLCRPILDSPVIINNYVTFEF